MVEPVLAFPAGALLTFGLLTAAIVALWLPWRPSLPRLTEVPGGALWLLLLAATLASAMVYGFLDFRGALSLIALAACLAVAYNPKESPWRRFGGVFGAVFMGFALTAHQMPEGYFTNPKVLADVALSPAAIPYGKYLNLDKGAAGLLIAAFAGAGVLGLANWHRTLAATLPIAGATIAALLGLSWALGYVTWEPGWPPILLFWAWTNLFFTCVAEEALFRGLIQGRLAAALTRWRCYPQVAICVAALLFGAAHFAGGWRYMLLSTVAGLGYGWAFQRTGRLEAAIATHFAVNLVHFTLFTYPALAGG